MRATTVTGKYWKKLNARFTLVDALGAGTYGIVYRAIERGDRGNEGRDNGGLLFDSALRGERMDSIPHHDTGLPTRLPTRSQTQTQTQTLSHAQPHTQSHTQSHTHSNTHSNTHRQSHRHTSAQPDHPIEIISETNDELNSFVASSSQSSVQVALKFCRIDSTPECGIPETVVREAVILADLRKCPRVMRMLGLSATAAPPECNKLVLVCELLDCDLRGYMKRFERRLIPGRESQHIMRRILQGVDYCHFRDITHRDLKPHNILIRIPQPRQTTLSCNEGGTATNLVDPASDTAYQSRPSGSNFSPMNAGSGDIHLEVKIGDFGLARPRYTPYQPLTHDVVTLWYRPPEILLGETRYDFSTDIWSLGCIFVELLTGQVLFPGDSELDTLFRIFQFLGTPPPQLWPSEPIEPHAIFPRFPAPKQNPFVRLLAPFAPHPSAYEAAERMLSLDPKRRPSAAECLRFECFGSLKEKLPLRTI